MPLNADKPDVEVILCSRDRAPHLAQTLRWFQEVVPPPDCRVRLTVVDNGSTDDTRAVVESSTAGVVPTRYLYEPLPGQARARNLGLRETGAPIIVFTDDDVRPEPDWIARLVEPIVCGEAEIVGGGVRMAPHLERPWIKGILYGAFADTRYFHPDGKTEPVGANAAIHRRVLEKVPQFDEELDPGRLGFGGDTLFFMQLAQAGFRLVHRLDARIEHHFEENRLRRSSLIACARRMGHARAYIRHHWHHHTPYVGRRGFALQTVRRKIKESWERRRSPLEEGITEAEYQEIIDLNELSYWQKIYRQPRNYEKHGLVKLHDTAS